MVNAPELRPRETVQRVSREKPQVLELGGMVAGAAVGLALPATPQERNIIAPQREQIVQKLDSVADQAVGKVQQAVE